ncbi:hypothetical protein B0H14DRAFT_2564670 [Mycena olivaceomarginata]|nr:hypothetical protein B0H14DRAFT_2564670 [Mycena olivaceomarginata]
MLYHLVPYLRHYICGVGISQGVRGGQTGCGDRGRMAKRSPLEDSHGAGCFEQSRTWPVAVQSKKKPLGAQAQHCREVVFPLRCETRPRSTRPKQDWTDVGGSSSGDFLWWYLAQFAGVAVSFHFFCVDIAELAGVPAIALAGGCAADRQGVEIEGRMAKRSPLEDSHGAGCFEQSRTWPVAVQSKKKPLGAQAQHCREVVFLSVARLAQGPRALNRIWTDVGGSSSGDFLWWYLASLRGWPSVFHFFCVDIAELAGVPAIALAGCFLPAMGVLSDEWRSTQALVSTTAKIAITQYVAFNFQDSGTGRPTKLTGLINILAHYQSSR